MFFLIPLPNRKKNMKKKNVTEENIKYAQGIHADKNLKWDEKMAILMKYFGKSERTVRKWLAYFKVSEKENPETSEQYEDAKKREYDKTKKRFIITWAQNDTPIHKEFFKNIKAYAKFIDADVHVIAGRYKNPTSVFTNEQKKGDKWAKDVLPYLDANRHDIHKHVSVMSDVKIQPTGVNPLTGLGGLSGINSCIFGSPKVHMEVLGALEGHKPKIMFTTGAVTKSNYTDSKAGKKGEFHHTLGFVVVEIKNEEKFFARQVTARASGEFTDLYFKVKEQKVSKIKQIEALILGDVHLGDEDEEVMKATKELLDKVKPNHTVIHDLFDGYSISHHHVNDPVLQYQKEVAGTNSLKKEVDNMLKWLEKMKKYNLVIVRSNHDDFVDRWVINSDWKKNIKNSMEYMEYARVLLANEAPKGLIPYIINQKFKDIKTLGRMDSFKVKSWELGAHGDYGQNGSRGSLNQFRNLNTKIVLGHSHTPGRKDGSLSVGTSTKLRLGYNLGASTWLHSHVMIHKDGKAQHIIMIGGEFTTLKW